MDNKLKELNGLLLDSLKLEQFYKKEVTKILSHISENEKYKKYLYNLDNTKKGNNFLSFCFYNFFQHNKWINPINIDVFLYKNHFEIYRNDIHDKIEINIIKQISRNNLMKLFLYFELYSFIYIEEIFIHNDGSIQIIKNNSDKINHVHQIMLLFNYKIYNMYTANIINEEEAFSFLYLYLFFIEYFSKNFFENQLKYINYVIFSSLFDLLEKLSINIISKEDNNKGIDILFHFLEDFKNNKIIENDYNSIILINNNIIQNYIEKIIQKINPIKIGIIFPNYLEKLVHFYSSVIKYRFDQNKTMEFLLKNTKNGFINLKYLKEDRKSIIKDLFVQKFQIDLLDKLFTQENNRLLSSRNSFLFNGMKSKLSFLYENISLSNNIIIFSFCIKTNIYNNNLYNETQPLIKFYNKKNETIYQLILKKDNGDAKKKKKDNQTYFKLNLIFGKNEVGELNELGLIEPEKIYYICIHLNEQFIHTHLSSSEKNSKILESNGEVKIKFNKEEIFLNVGYDDKNFFTGYIGNLYIYKLNKKGNNKIDLVDNKKIIKNILCLKEWYEYIIYYLNTTDDLNDKYYLDYLTYYKNKTDSNEMLKILKDIRINAKNSYELIFCLTPNTLKVLSINENSNINLFILPKVAGICKKINFFL